MFENKRYITKGFQEIPLELQLTIFQLIDELKSKGRMDYLQVFQLEAEGKYIQNLEHRSEVPEYIKRYRFAFSNTVTAKVFVIDNGSVTTAMLAEEY